MTDLDGIAQLTSLQEVASQLEEGGDLVAILQRLIGCACRHAGWTMGSVMAIDVAQGFGQVLVRHDPTLIAAQLADRWELGSSPALVALKRNEPVHIPDARQATDFPGYRQDAQERDYRSVLVMPMHCRDADGRPMVLTVISRQGKEVSAADLAFLGAILHLGRLAVEREHRRSAAAAETARLSRALNAERQMLEHVLADGPAAALAGMVGTLLAGPVLVADFSDSQILAGQSPDLAAYSDAEWQAAAPGRLARQILRAAREEGPLRLVDEGRQIDLPARITPVLVDGQVLGALIVFASAPDPLLLDSARLALAVQILRNSLRFRSETHAQTGLIRDLVEARWRNEAEMLQRASHLGLNLRVPHQMIVLEAAESAASPGGALAGFRRTLARLAPGEAALAMTAVLEDRIICLLPVDSEFRRSRIRGLADLVAAELARGQTAPPVVVLGGICATAADYAGVWQRCGRLMGIAQSFGLTGVLAADGSGPMEMLASALEAPDLRGYVETSLGPLLRHDRDHCTDYLDTLATYLREGCRSQPCADAMGLHVSTLRYRLARIRDLFGIEIDSPEKRFDLELAVRLQMILRSG